MDAGCWRYKGEKDPAPDPPKLSSSALFWSHALKTIGKRGGEKKGEKSQRKPQNTNVVNSWQLTYLKVKMTTIILVTIKELSCVLSILPKLFDLILTTLRERFPHFVDGETHAYRSSWGSTCLPKAVYDQTMRETKSQEKDLSWLEFCPVEANSCSRTLNSQTESTHLNNFFLLGFKLSWE